MGRPKKCRSIACSPGAVYFKPRGIPLTAIDEVSLEPDEFEAINLADDQGLYHEEAARMMGISRPTFGRILTGARRKIADAIVHGKALRIMTGTETEAT
jgi:predicted DNA-binding protein (UPF0251 family)